MDKSSIERIRNSFKSPNPNTRRYSLFTTAKYNLTELSDEIMILFRKEKNAEIKGLCAWVLGRLRYQKSLDDLVEGLQSNDINVRIWSAWALGEMGIDQAIIPLMQAKDRETRHDVRRAIGGALKKLRFESTRVHARHVFKKLRPPSTNDPNIALIVERLESLEWNKDADEIITLREQILERDPAYLEMYMDWLKRKPALLTSLDNKRNVYSDELK